tara:strand:+ start:325 stop:546 length:222 start_codon:yes stop_codon:yes gene_type:complete
MLGWIFYERKQVMNSNVTIPLDDRYTLSVRNENNQVEFAILDGNDLVTLRNDDTVMRVNDWAELLYEIGKVRV